MSHHCAGGAPATGAQNVPENNILTIDLQMMTEKKERKVLKKQALMLDSESSSGGMPSTVPMETHRMHRMY